MARLALWAGESNVLGNSFNTAAFEQYGSMIHILDQVDDQLELQRANLTIAHILPPR